MKKIEASVRISRATGGGEDRMDIVVTCCSSGIDFVEVSFSLEDFMKILTAQAGLRGAGKVRGLEFVGSRCESMTAELPSFDQWTANGSKTGALDKHRKKHTKDLRAEGWIDRESDWTNIHRKKGGCLSEITMYRFVDEGGEPIFAKPEQD